jgi:hypothetical protein
MVFRNLRGNSQMKRRNFLRGAAGAAIALPFMESLGPRRATAATRPKRFVVMASVLGTFPEKFWPREMGAQPWPENRVPHRDYATGNTDYESDAFQLEEIAAPLSAHIKDLIFVEGLDRVNCSGHGGYCNWLSGRDGSGKLEEEGQGISLDQAIAQKIGVGTKFESLQVGINNSGAGKYSCLSWYGKGKPAPAEPRPELLFARLFAEISGNPEEQMRFASLRRQRKSILDGAVDQARRLESRLGASDKRKLKDYLDSIRTVEERLTSVAAVQGCSRPEEPSVGADLKRVPVELSPQIAEIQIELLAMAFACDLSRVSTLQFGHEGSEMTHPWLDVNTGHHSLSHVKPNHEAYVDRYKDIRNINRWHAENLARLITRLKSLSDGDGNVWDNTLVMWINGLTWGCFHSDEQIPVMLAGSAGGYWKTGRHLRYAREGKTPHATSNDLLLEVGRAFGLEGSAWGDAKFHGRSLANLKGRA